MIKEIIGGINYDFSLENDGEEYFLELFVTNSESQEDVYSSTLDQVFDGDKIVFSGDLSLGYYVPLSIVYTIFKMAAGVRVAYDSGSIGLRTLPQFYVAETSQKIFDDRTLVELNLSESCDLSVLDSVGEIFASSAPAQTHAFYVNNLAATRPILLKISKNGQILNQEIQVLGLPQINFALTPFHTLFIEAGKLSLQNLVSAGLQNIISNTQLGLTSDQLFALQQIIISIMISHNTPEAFARRLALWFKYQNLYVTSASAQALTTEQKIGMIQILAQVAGTMVGTTKKIEIRAGIDLLNSFGIIASDSPVRAIYQTIFGEALADQPTYDLSSLVTP